MRVVTQRGGTEACQCAAMTGVALDKGARIGAKELKRPVESRRNKRRNTVKSSSPMH